MAYRFVGRTPLVVGLLVGLAAGCGGGGTTGDLDKIQVTLGRFDISVTNTSGSVLTEVVAEIGCAGAGNHFVARPATLQSGERRTLAHTSFMDRDSVPFSPRNAKATHVTVTAKGLDGQVLQVEMPFKS